MLPLHLEIERQIGLLQRDGLSGQPLALLNRCSQIIKGFEERLTIPALTMPSEAAIRLACGEMTAQEMRTVKAALQWFIYANNLRRPQVDR